MATPPPLPPRAGDEWAAIVPYRNAPALISYYCGVFSLIPFLGVFLAIAAIVLGIVGLRAAKQNPTAKGKVHAWVGISLAILVIVGHAALFALIFYNASNRP